MPSRPASFVSFRSLLVASVSGAVLLGASSALPVSAFAANSPDADELDQIVISATRTRRRVQDEPIRVEIIPREEIDESDLEHGTFRRVPLEFVGADYSAE